MLRLEHLLDRLAQLVPRDTAVDHHFALVTMFELFEIASRAEVKTDLLKELERHKAQFTAYRSNPQVSQAALDQVIDRIEQAVDGLNQQQGKAGQSLVGHEWLASVRSRISIPAGTCGFDLPAYHAWQQREPDRRRTDLMTWIDTLAPLAEALNTLLQLLRDAGVPHKVISSGGQFQQSLPAGRNYQLLRLRIDGGDELVPEITGHRLIVSVRLMRTDAEGRLRPAAVDMPFELTLCA